MNKKYKLNEETLMKHKDFLEYFEKKVRIPKKSGGFREIWVMPTWENILQPKGNQVDPLSNANYLIQQVLGIERSNSVYNIIFKNLISLVKWTIKNKRTFDMISLMELLKEDDAYYKERAARLINGRTLNFSSVVNAYSWLEKFTEQVAEASKILDIYPQHKDAIAYKKKVDFTKEIKNLGDFKTFYKFDFSDFFGSFRLNNVAVDSKLYDMGLHESLLNCIFMGENRAEMVLKQGHSLSPKLTNVVMYDFDDAMSKWAAANNAVYKRYCDDIIIATNETWHSKKAFNTITAIIKQEAQWLRLNNKKTRIMSKKGSAKFLGLSISEQNGVSVGWRTRKKAMRRAVLNKKRNTVPSPQELGIINWVNHNTDDSKKIRV